MRSSKLSYKEINFANKKNPFLLFALALMVVLGTLFASRFYFGYYFSSKGKEFLENRDYSNADKAINKAIFFNPADASYYDLKANLLYNKYLKSSNSGFLSEAIDELYSALSLNSQNAPLFEHLGFIYSALGVKEKDKERAKFLESSLKCYLAAKKLEPFNAYYWNSTGEIYFNLNQLGKAEREFKTLIAIEPNFLPGRVNLLKLYEKTKRSDLAKKEIDDILDIYDRNRHFSFSGVYENNFLNINIDEIKAKAENSKEIYKF